MMEELDEAINEGLAQNPKSAPDLFRHMEGNGYKGSLPTLKRRLQHRGIRLSLNNDDKRLQNLHLLHLVANTIDRTGAVYGRKMMCGALRAVGVAMSAPRVGRALNSANPFYQQLRRHNLAVQVNPQPYRSIAFGERMHMDQNEKLQPYGCCLVMAVDGHSGMVVASEFFYASAFHLLKVYIPHRIRFQ